MTNIVEINMLLYVIDLSLYFNNLITWHNDILLLFQMYLFYFCTVVHTGTSLKYIDISKHNVLSQIKNI